jgi:hypothetical protein
LLSKPRSGTPGPRKPKAQQVQPDPEPAPDADPEVIVEALDADELESIITGKWDEDKLDVLRSKLGAPSDLAMMLKEQTPAVELLVVMLAGAYGREDLLKLAEQLSEWLTRRDEVIPDDLTIPSILDRGPPSEVRQ